MEHQLGHRLIPGRHNVAVMAALRTDGRTDIADWMAIAKADQVDRPEAAKSFQEHQKEKRTHIAKADVACDTLSAWRAADSGTAFQTGMADSGYRLARGREGGIIIIDPAGGSHELTRTLRAALKTEGDKRPSREVRAEIDRKTADLDRTALPEVAEAVASAREGVSVEPAAAGILPKNRDQLESTEAPTAAAVLARLTKGVSTFTERALDAALKAVPAENRAALKTEVLALAVDLTLEGDGSRRLTTRASIETEAALLDDAEALIKRRGSALDPATAEAAIAAAVAKIAERDGFEASAEQKLAARHVLCGPDLTTVTGVAGSGKSTALELALAGWSATGSDVHGLALSGIAAQRLAETGIASETIESRLLRWDRQAALAAVQQTGALTGAGKAAVVGALNQWIAATEARGQDAGEIRRRLDQVDRADRLDGLDRKTRRWLSGWLTRQLLGHLTRRSVLVIDEAGMVDVRLMGRVLAHARAAGARVVAVGDPEQLQPIEAGAAFRLLMQRAKAAEITEVVRQREAWQCRATEQFSTGRVAAAVAAYAEHEAITTGIAGHLDPAALQEAAEKLLGRPLDEWEAGRLTLVAEYREARLEAGSLWAEIQDGSDQPDDHPLYHTFKEAQERRDTAARAIGADLDSARPWLERLAVDGEGLAADLLFAKGTRRAEAKNRAADHAARLGLDTLNPATTPLAPDVGAAVRAALFDDWHQDMERDGLSASRLMLAYRRADVAALNTLARTAYRAAGHLYCDDTKISTNIEGKPGTLALAIGDRVLCLKNDRQIGVKNGSVGTVTAILVEDGKTALIVQLDGRPTPVEIDPARYGALTHGYAATIHRTQGVTVDRSWLLDDQLLDRHLAYVGMSRHRQKVRVFSAAPDLQALARRWGRGRTMDAISDHVDPRIVLRRPEAAALAMRQAVGRAAGTVQTLGERLRAAVSRFFSIVRQPVDALSATPAKDTVHERARIVRTARKSDSAHFDFQPPPAARGRMRELSEIPVASAGNENALLLSAHVRDHMADQGSDHSVRRPDPLSTAAADRAALYAARAQPDLDSPERFRAALDCYQKILVNPSDPETTRQARADLLARGEQLAVTAPDQATREAAKRWAAEASRLTEVKSARAVHVARA
ncbi:MAG: AAA family ATPase [Rhodospirillaceae bacterium]